MFSEAITMKTYTVGNVEYVDMADEMSNYYIAEITKTEQKNGREKAIERASRWLGSLYLGRDFGETAKSYDVRNPDIAEFSAWFKKYRLQIPCPTKEHKDGCC